MKLGITSVCLLGTISLCNFTISPSVAQISSDGTLSTTVTSDDGINFLIENGDRFRDDVNLFHSFREFSIPNLGEAYFNNPTDIVNIFSRVTGGNISDIQGLIRANGTANLFLINPAGIIFGENASLDIGGSFFASTAESIVFGEGLEFSATQPQSAPLLTVNITPGLQYGANPLPMEVSGASLAVNAGQSISLLGGDVAISNSEISAPGGQINLGGLAQTGIIQIEELNATFPENTALSNLNLTDAAIIDVTSTNNGSIAINAADLSMSGSSEILAGLTSTGNTADAVSRNIIINATGNINLTEKSLIANDLEIDAIGNSGNIEINTNSLSITGGSRIQSVTNSSGTSGDITIYANTGIVIDGFTDDGLFSGVLSRSATETAGAGGNIAVNSPQNTLTLSNRGFIGAVTNSNSDGGNIETNLNNLVIESGGQIVTATTNLGNAGDITINATESVSISGDSLDFATNPFLDLETFDLNTLEFITGLNPNVAESETIPYVSVERTPTQIVSGTTILGAAADQVDYYSFSVTQSGSRAILDIDFGEQEEPEGRIDTTIYLFDLRTGELLEVNDDSFFTDGAEGSEESFGPFSTDSLIDTTLDESGFYILGVAAFPSDAASNELIEGNNPDVGDTYILQASIENQGAEGVTIPVNSLNPENYNPNVEATSGLFSESSGIGNGGTLTINTGQLLIENNGRLSADNSNLGQGGNLILNVENTTTIRDSALVSSITRGDGNAGSIVINTGRLEQSNDGDILSNTFAFGNGGSIEITAQESVILNNTDESSEEISEILSDGLSGSTGNSGQITIETPILRVLGGSEISSAIEGEGNGGNIEILANVLEIRGRSPNGVFVSEIEGHTRSNDEEATGSTIIITAQEVSISDGGFIFGTTSGAADAGDLIIETEVLQVTNDATISLSTLDKGNAGDITITTEELQVSGGSQIRAATRDEGDGGSITINASENVEITGVDEEDDSSGLFLFTRSDSTGNGGSLILEARTLQVTDDATINASSSGVGMGGSLIVEVDQLRVLTGGEIQAAAFGEGNAGDILLRGNDLEVNGIFEDGTPSAITAFSETDAAAGSVDINFNNLTVNNGAQITVANTGTGDAGNLNINANSINLDNAARLSAEANAGNEANVNLDADNITLTQASTITTNLFETASGGELIVNTNNLLVSEGSQITAANASAGNAGNLNIQANQVEVTGVREDNSTPSTISAGVLPEGTGVGGRLNINSQNLDVNDGAIVTVSTLGAGNAGNLNINNTESVIVSDRNSAITAESQTGATAGSVTITTPELLVDDNAIVSVTNTGTGDAGNLNINAENIFLDNQGRLAAEVAAGNQGNINLTSQFLLLRRNSNITTNAGNQANGGNITIETVNLVALENSDITANAIEGQGGNIIITAQGLFLSPDSEISASSEFGVDGVVTINNPEADENAALLELPEDTTDPSQQIAEGCAWVKTNSFIVTGRGGTAENPTNNLDNDQMWSDVRDLSDNQSSVTNQQSLVSQPVVIEANAWIVNEQGKVELVAVVNPQNTQNYFLSGNCVGE